MPCDSACSRMVLLSYPLSVSSISPVNPSIKPAACVQSATVPDVIIARIGIPCASTARCILVLSPLLCDSCPDFRPLRPPHADALCNATHQSSATRNLVPRQILRAVFPTNLCRASGKNGVVYFSSPQGRAEDRATGHRCAESRILR